MLRLRRSAVPSTFHVLGKPTGAICNLDCSYCFFLAKEELYPGSTFRMSDGLLETYIRQLLESHRDPEVTIAWQGGEPTLMGLDFFRRVVELVERYRRPDQVIEHTIQTNGTLIDDEWAAFLAEHDFLVGISIDGPRELHDAYRVDKGGKPTFDRVIAGLDRLKAHGVRWNVLTTVHHANEDHGLEVYRFLRDDLGAEFIQLIPIVELPSPGGIPTGSDVTERSVSPDGLRALPRRGVRRVGAPRRRAGLRADVRLDAGELRRRGRVAVRPRRDLRHRRSPSSTTATSTPATTSSSPSTCSATSPSAPCSSWWRPPQQKAFGDAKRDTLPAYCRSCDVRFACNGGCPKDRFTTTPDGEPGLHYLCPSYQAFFRHVDQPMRFMAAQLRSGGYADAVMGWVARRDQRT